MAEPHVITGLIAKRAEIAGKIEHLQDELRALVIDLDNIDHTIHVFDPSIELQEISKRPVPQGTKPSRGKSPVSCCRPSGTPRSHSQR